MSNPGGTFFKDIAKTYVKLREQDRDLVLIDSDAQYTTFIEKRLFQDFVMNTWPVLGNFWLIFREMAKIYVKSRKQDKDLVLIDSDAQYTTFIEKK